MLCFIASITCGQISATTNTHYVKATALITPKNQILLDIITPILNISQTDPRYKEIFTNYEQMDYVPFFREHKGLGAKRIQIK